MQERHSIATRTRTRIDAGIVIWASFLAACIATMVFFAFFDPLLLVDDRAPPSWLRDRMTGYTIGFFFFWITCALASAFTALLVDTRADPAASEKP
jgi:hypothetical protein